MTDHRINLTLYKLEQLIEGNIDPLIDALIEESNKIMKIIKAIKDATTFLELHTNQSSQQCKIEAEEIFMFVFGVNKSRMYSSDTLLVSDQHLGHIYQILNKRKENIPLSYLLKAYFL